MKRLITVVMLVVSALWALGASAQMYPNRPIKLIVADSAGGAPDQLGRLITERLSNNVNQPVVVDNRPGAGGALGASCRRRFIINSIAGSRSASLAKATSSRGW